MDLSTSRAVLAFSDFFNVPHFPPYAASILASCAFFCGVQYAVAVVSPKLFPKSYAKLDGPARTDWTMHATGWVHALISTPLCFYLILNPSPAVVQDPVKGFAATEGAVIAISAGYFLWDLLISIYLVRRQGPAFLLHASACCFIFLKAYTPFLNGFACHFLVWELSTIFLHPHWFFDKLGLTGSTLQLVNGIFLLLSFFGVRIVYGLYRTIDLWQLLGDAKIPLYLRWGFRLANLALIGLNLSWFRLMILSVAKRFQASDKSPASSKSKKL